MYKSTQLADPDATEEKIRKKIIDQLGHSIRKAKPKAKGRATRTFHAKKRPTAAELAERKRQKIDDVTNEDNVRGDNSAVDGNDIEVRNETDAGNKENVQQHNSEEY